MIIGAQNAHEKLGELIAELRQILRDAADGESSDFRDAVFAAQDRLEEFWKATSPADSTDQAEVEAVRKVDTIARDMFFEIGMDSIEANNAILAAGAIKLAALAQDLQGIAEDTEEAAAAIALKPIKSAVEAMTGMVDTVKDLKNQLDDAQPDHAAIIAEVEVFAQRFQTLKQKVKALVN